VSNIPKEAEERVTRAVAAARRGERGVEKCWFCDGMIHVSIVGTYVVFTCPCKKSAGFLHGI
jgi:hypothetical protein